MEGGLMKGTNEEGKERGMDSAKERGEGGSERRRRLSEEGREQGREGNFKGGIPRRALASVHYIHKPSHNAALGLDTLILQMKNSEQVSIL